MTISAKVIAHSRSRESLPDIYTLELEYPRFIHQEFMTHRVFSRNASSSRAMSIRKNLEQILANPAMPIHWGLNEKGMQAHNTASEKVQENAALIWRKIGKWACSGAEELNYIGLHKQIVNRVIEPFSHIRVIVTATEWDNFFALRLHPDAQPEIQELARVMKFAMEESEPCYLHPGEWHLPYIMDDEYSVLSELEARMVSVARCARVSYKASADSVQKDIELYERLRESGHMSPFEHVATPMESLRYNGNIDLDYNTHCPDTWETGITHMDMDYYLWSGNFKGWIQYRQLFEQ